MLRLIGIIAITLSFSVSYAQAQDKDGIIYNEDGSLYTGEFITYHSNGSADAIYQIDQGVFHGNVVWHDEIGNKIESGSYTEGEKDGPWYQWTSEGQLTAEAHYFMGQKDGVWTIWDDEGLKRYHMVYHMNEKIDVWKMWDGQSNLLSEQRY